MTAIRLLSALLISSGLTGCAAVSDPPAIPRHDNTDAVIWLQSSSEYAALTTGLYVSATAALDRIAADGDPSGMAIVLDVDETVLDNSPYQGQLILDDDRYRSETWDPWLALRDAVEVPGVVEFIQAAQTRGFHIAFITNRTCQARPTTQDRCPQIEDTRVNLEAVGIDTSKTTLFLRGQQPPQACLALLTEAEQPSGVWSTSDKTSRRACVEQERDIVMLFGDQMGDFTEAHGSDGRSSAAAFDKHWGRTWFMLPNPTYGGWKPRDAAEKRARIRAIR
ncbi:MAG: HAD family acid phosphatase [Pseudomonadota bacterium]